jgi:GNAT superfamily N-acetyltransferase
MLSVADESEHASEIAAELAARLVRFNEAKAGPLRQRHVALAIRDDDGELVGGLTGELFWNTLYVHVLWVNEELRGQRYGSSLLAQAEALAREHGCWCVYLSTFRFQAPAFYARRGYSVIGELTEVPPGAGRQWFSKRLSAVASAEAKG